MRFSVASNSQISGAERKHFSPSPRERKKMFSILEDKGPTTGVAEAPVEKKAAHSELDLNLLLTAESMVQRVPPPRVKQTWQAAELQEIRELRTRESTAQKSRENVKQRWR
jgi:hypothetical protein